MLFYNYLVESYWIDVNLMLQTNIKHYISKANRHILTPFGCYMCKNVYIFVKNIFMFLINLFIY